MHKNRRIQLVELMSICLVRYGLFFVIKNKKIARESLVPGKTYLIVANHAGGLDPFIITANLPWAYIRKLTPFWFITANKFFNKSWLLPLLKTHGCYPANNHRGLKSGLSHTIELVKSKQCVVMFPEGRVSRIDRQFAPKKGIEAIINMTSPEVIPVRVKWNVSKKFFKSYSLAVGKPFSAKHMTAEQIMDVVYDLKFR